MLIMNVKSVIKNYKECKESSDLDKIDLLRMVRETSYAYLEDSKNVPLDQDYQNAGDYIEEITGIRIPNDMLKKILFFYPRECINLASDDFGNSSVQEGITFAIAHFFLGCSWPLIGDEVDIDLFLEALKYQVSKMKFMCLSN